VCEDKCIVGAWVDASNLVYCWIPTRKVLRFERWVVSKDYVMECGAYANCGRGITLVAFRTVPGKQKYACLAASSFIRTITGGEISDV
jgi:hypothetical protein